MASKLSYNDRNRLITLYGRWALVTGASSGIGKEICKQLAESTFNLVIVGRNEKHLQNLQSELLAKFNVDVEIIIADLARQEDVYELIKKTSQKQIGLAVLSAGYGTSGQFIENSLSDELNMLDVNCKALTMLAHHFGNRFSTQMAGGLVLLGSLVSFQGVPYAAHYAATKAYVLSLGEALHHELKLNNADVLTACPGPVASGFGSRADIKMEGAMKPGEIAIPILKALGKKSVILPGLLTKILTYALRTVPRWGKVLIMKKVMTDMTKHQKSVRLAYRH
ncbi:SDR family NAD(P)-dependent oxidoreductase [Fulvivirga lutimaris]|uniref:SDR family NAD(P)-dependent oxidoreductase n=1 Tax=Fulvivirga lutimaris TaxID=1819566 RepID=UPI0012BBFEFE|nr:SDR family NAD(P)-dependent oxidoreductase [Fulvivirga lutimaris]MTI41451.1 SDR family NAD(P)-dependent oxidoreductase [Fulvivirga lutimaris]